MNLFWYLQGNEWREVIADDYEIEFNMVIFYIEGKTKSFAIHTRNVDEIRRKHPFKGD